MHVLPHCREPAPQRAAEGQSIDFGFGFWGGFFVSGRGAAAEGGSVLQDAKVVVLKAPPPPSPSSTTVQSATGTGSGQSSGKA